MKLKLLFCIIATMLIIPNISFSIVTTNQNQTNNERVYIYFSKTFYQGYDCSKTPLAMLLFEFNSKGAPTKNFSHFIDSYVAGMKSNGWSVAFFYDYEKSLGHKHSCDSRKFEEKFIPPDFVYFESLADQRENKCYFYKLYQPFPASKVDVEVHYEGPDRNKIVSFLDFYDESRIANQLNKYRGTDAEYAEMVSGKIDDKIYDLFKYKTKNQCN